MRSQHEVSHWPRPYIRVKNKKKTRHEHTKSHRAKRDFFQLCTKKKLELLSSTTIFFLLPPVSSTTKLCFKTLSQLKTHLSCHSERPQRDITPRKTASTLPHPRLSSRVCPSRPSSSGREQLFLFLPLSHLLPCLYACLSTVSTQKRHGPISFSFSHHHDNEKNRP